MKYLIIGGGAREHALYWRLTSDGSAKEVYVSPGNGGVPEDYCVELKTNRDIVDFCNVRKINAVVVGPEAPLVDGLVDYLEGNDIRAFGPRKEAAMLEGSKLFSKMIMEKYNVPTAGHHDFKGKAELVSFIEKNKSYPIVIKLDGLASGKGVGIPNNKKEAMVFIDQMVKEDSEVFVEDYLDGEEASVLGISDGERVFPLIPAQDHKRAFDNDKGPNTGGMGAYAPTPVMDADLLEKVRKTVLQPVVDGMKKEGKPFKGILYAGLMVKGREIKVLEFNVRFGDPEAQAVLPLLEGKLGDLINASIDGKLKPEMIRFKNKFAMTVVVASGGYPGEYEKGKEITGLDKIDGNVMVFHAGSTRKDGKLVTSGGRVLSVTSMDDSLKKAHDSIYKEIKKIQIDGSFYRKDIAHRAFKK